MPTRLRDGRVLHAARNRDDALRPDLMLWDKIVDKFMSNALFSGLVDQQRADMAGCYDFVFERWPLVKEFTGREVAEHDPVIRILLVPRRTEGPDEGRSDQRSGPTPRS